MMHLAQRRPGREPRRHADADGADGSAAARSTKAGARTPATRGVPRRPPPRAARSTKAGARTPATQRRAVASCAVMATAQRRPGREPRRHARADAGGSLRAAPLNEGRGANPGDTCRVTGTAPLLLTAQRRPGREPRRHLHRWLEGAHDDTAQRRPGREPRRHPAALARLGALGGHRSTKAGARTPATLRTASPWSSSCACAQRRPGREPRRHASVQCWAPRTQSRSTKAGARTPATRPGRFADPLDA